MYNIGIVGAGIIAEYHKNAMLKNTALQLAAVCDLNIAKAQYIAKDTGASVYTDYKQMQQETELDAVILNLPHYLHKEVTIYFLEKHIPVLVEKPMALNTAECDAMIEAAQRNQTPLYIGHVQKYFSCYKKLREIVKSEQLGKFCSMTETRNTNYFTAERPAWFLNRKLAGGGIVMNYCAHTLDKLFYVTELDVNEVYAVGNNFANDRDVEASAQVLLKLSGGESAAFTYCATNVPNQYDTYFYFTEGTVYVEKGGDKLWIMKNGAPPEEVELDDSKSIFERQIDELVKMLNGEETELVNTASGRKIIATLEKIMLKIGTDIEK